MLPELRSFARLFFYENLSSGLMVLMSVLYINAGLYLADFYSLMRRKSLLETFCVLCLPCVTALVGSTLAAIYLHVPEPGSLQMVKFVLALTNKRLCTEILLIVAVYLLLWGFAYLSQGRRTAKQRRSWILTCAPDYLFCIVILTVSTWRILGGKGFLLSQWTTYVYLYCIAFLSCKIILLAVGLLVALYSVKITVFRWKEGKNPSAFLLRYFLLYQNAIFRNVFLYGIGTMFFLISSLARSGELQGEMIGVMLFLALGLIFILMAAIGPVIKGMGRFYQWGKNAGTLKETFCREYFQEDPIYRDHRYTITKNFLVDEQMPATFYYWPCLSRMTGWCLTKKGKTRVLYFSDASTCSLTENDMPTAGKITEYANSVLERRVSPREADPMPQKQQPAHSAGRPAANKLEQGYNTLLRWLIFLVAMFFAFAQFWA